MFVFNVSLTQSKITKYILFSIIVILIASLMFFLIKSNKKNNTNTPKNNNPYIEVTDKNYTNVLDACYKKTELYVGKKIKFSGFVYRLFDFNENQFVLAREMIIDTPNDNQVKAVVVGFLCDFDNASSFLDGDWVEVDGTISNGFYHSPIPVLEVTSARKTECPKNQYVYPPDNGYVITE